MEENYGIETSETSDSGDAKVRERNVQENDGDCEGDANEGGEFCANKIESDLDERRCGVSVASGDDDFDLLFEFVRDQ